MSCVVRVEEVSWSRLSDQDKRAFQLIYEDVFPASERRALESIMASRARVWVARRDDRLVGFAVATVLGAVGAALLQYLAVTPPMQSGGVGSALLAVLARDLPVEGVFLEVEVPPGDDGAGAAARRLAFYERWGAQRLECLAGYFMADYAEPGGRIPMLLLWKPLVPVEQPRGERLCSALKAIFDNSYAQVAGPDYLTDLLACVRCADQGHDPQPH